MSATAPHGLEVLGIDSTQAAKLVGVAPSELELGECDGKKIVASLVRGKVIERGS